eukprot:gene17253-biopygen10652
MVSDKPMQRRSSELAAAMEPFAGRFNASVLRLNRNPQPMHVSKERRDRLTMTACCGGTTHCLSTRAAPQSGAALQELLLLKSRRTEEDCVDCAASNADCGEWTGIRLTSVSI